MKIEEVIKQLESILAHVCSMAAEANADRIRTMSDEELGRWVCDHMTGECCDSSCPGRHICDLGNNGLIKWLKQPAEED